MREKILTFIEKNSRIDLKELEDILKQARKIQDEEN